MRLQLTSSARGQGLRRRAGRIRRYAIAVMPMGLAACACLVETGPNSSAHDSGRTARTASGEAAAKPAPKRTVIAASKAKPQIGAALLAAPAAPDCEILGVDPSELDPGPPEEGADPNLVRVARLELIRDCYRKAEEAARQRLEKLQQQVKKTAN